MRSAGVQVRSGAIRWSALVFLLIFTVLLIAVATYVLVPGFEAIQDKQLSPEEKRSLQAWYRLLMFVLLFILFAGLVLTFRFGRLFFPRATSPRTQTQYVDAWAESARRLEVPPATAADDDDDDDAPPSDPGPQ
jgi:peptidoglycan biosynthesis protein MviN/MurJ (putative lipid II flippase)